MASNIIWRVEAPVGHRQAAHRTPNGTPRVVLPPHSEGQKLPESSLSNLHDYLIIILETPRGAIATSGKLTSPETLYVAQIRYALDFQ